MAGYEILEIFDFLYNWSEERFVERYELRRCSTPIVDSRRNETSCFTFYLPLLMKQQCTPFSGRGPWPTGLSGGEVDRGWKAWNTPS